MHGHFRPFEGKKREKGKTPCLFLQQRIMSGAYKTQYISNKYFYPRRESPIPLVCILVHCY